MLADFKNTTHEDTRTLNVDRYGSSAGTLWSDTGPPAFAGSSLATVT
jgi:hypothetical protein